MPNEIAETLSGQASILSELVASLLEPILAEHGASFGMFDMLTAVQSADGKLTQAEIARRLGIRPPSLTEALQSAVKKGLVQQSAAEGDQRSKRPVLTPKGKALLNRCLARLDEVEQTMTFGIAKIDLRTALTVMKQANKNLVGLLNR